MPPEPCCPHYHRAVELIGRRWSGAIVAVLLETSGDPVRFKDLAGAVPEISDRLLAERLKELQAAGVVDKADAGYGLTDQGRELGPAVRALQEWGQRWLAPV